MTTTKRIQSKKVTYSTIEAGLSMPIAYIQGNQIKTVFRTVKHDSIGFFVSINKKKQYIAKATKAYKGITTIVINGTNAISKKAEKTVTKVKAEKKQPKQAKKQPKQSEKEILLDFTPTIHVFPFFKDFLSNEENATIKQLIENTINGSTYKKKHIAGWKDTTGKKGTEKAILFETVKGMFDTSENLQDVQNATVLLLTDVIKSMAYKMLEFGASYKKKENRTLEQLEQAYSYMNASSNNGKITAYTVDDIYNELLVASYTMTFDKNMFQAVQNVFSAIYFRLSNVLRTEIRRNAKFKASMGHDEIMLEIDRQYTFTSEYFGNIVDMAKQTTKLTDNEAELLKMRLDGYSKKEINDMTNKRNDRTFQSIEKKLETRAGMTIKEVKAMAKQEKKTLSQKLQAMKQAKKSEQEQAEQAKQA